MIAPPLPSNWVQVGSWRTRWCDIPSVQLPPRAVVVADNHQQAVIAVAAHACHPQDLLIASTERLDQELADGLCAEGFSIVRGLGTQSQSITPPSEEEVSDSPGIWLLTSGSTGRPKRVLHTLASLTTVSSQQPRRTWLCAYSPGAYAWWQVITLGLAHPGTNIVCVDSHELDRWPQVARQYQVNAVSGTPTFWRHALWRDSQGVADVPLEQATLGGEPVDQSILDALRRLHPQARISWIYASSEAGAAIAVHDGRAGFPVAWLDRETPGRPVISVEGDELVLSSPFASEGNATSLRTGDRVEITDERVRIVGRVQTDEVNVGGSKVSVSEVRETLMRHPGVAWASAQGRRAPIVGQVVVADVVLRAGTTEADVRGFCAATLPEHAVPRRINVLADIPLAESLKSRV